MHINMLNEAMSCKMSVTEPKFGMCATMFAGSDRYAMVVTEVISKDKIRVDHMAASDYQGEKYTDETGAEFIPIFDMCKYAKVNDDQTGFTSRGKIYTLRKNHRWMPKGESLWGCSAIHLGKAEEYRDPSF